MKVTERFLKYVSCGTNSDETSSTCPSTGAQRKLGGAIAEELKLLGLSEVRQDGNGYIYALLPGTGERKDAPAIGFIAHMDTSPSVPGDGIRPSVKEYTGGDLVLDDGKSVLSPEEFPELASLAGQHLIVTDGTTLLGADDKAGIAEIITACEELLAEGEAHRPVAIAFTPDEEIGRGADRFDLSAFAARTAYTVDGGALGGIEYENFNAASLLLTVHGVNIHPGSAKNRMKNAILMANEFLCGLPAAEAPAHTEGYEGFYHACDISGDESLCRLSVIIRDHDRVRFEARKAYCERLAAYLNGKWGEGCFELRIRDSYYNMKEKLADHMDLIENARAAFAANGVTPFCEPVRGGTDGARLSFMGLPCPNLSTGGYNFHSCREYIPVESMETMVSVLKTLAKTV